MADAMSLEGDNEPRISFLFVTQTFIAIKRNQDSIGGYTVTECPHPFIRLNSQYFLKWKIFRQPESHPKLLFRSELSLG